MKQIKNLTILFIFFAYSLTFGQDADKILGKWVVGEEKNVVEVYKEDGKYFAKIIEIISKKDDKVKIGTVVLKDFEYNSNEKKWQKGKVFAPRKQKELDGELKLLNNNQLEVKAKLGFFSKNVIWNRKGE